MISGPVCGDQMLGRPAEVVYRAPLCANGSWHFELSVQPSIQYIGVRQYVLNDAELAASGLGLGEYIASRYSTGAAEGYANWTVPDYNLMWGFRWRSLHLGQIADAPLLRRNAFRMIGYNMITIRSARDVWDLSFGPLSASGRWQWRNGPRDEDWNVKSWIESCTNPRATTDQPWLCGPHGGHIPPGYSIYMAFALPEAAQRKTVPVPFMACPLIPPPLPPPPTSPPAPPQCFGFGNECFYLDQFDPDGTSVNVTGDEMYMRTTRPANAWRNRGNSLMVYAQMPPPPWVATVQMRLVQSTPIPAGHYQVRGARFERAGTCLWGRRLF